LFLLTLLINILRGDIEGVASCMVHSGLSFILTIYCMHLLCALYRQRKIEQEQERMDMEEEKDESKLCA
jgi:hypothetical protein